jgi:predicted RNase H-like HicB family nuclease
MAQVSKDDGVHEIDVWREEDGTWSATALTVDGANTNGRTISEVERNVREVIGLVLDLPRSAEAALQLHLTIRVGEAGLDRLIEEARQANECENSIRLRARETTKRAVIGLRNAGISVRDVERLTGVSAGQVSKLANA